ncbi:MAG: DUF1674 domain-containing protein [Hyphomicrobiales bacterium]|nr:MAG: DUF1674 domain-containing protein [Hyphomicrobiales bacterium]
MTDLEKSTPQRVLPEAAKRALAEAKQRREDKAQPAGQEIAEEFNGRKGLEPTRFGDWENKGIASDF